MLKPDDRLNRVRAISRYFGSGLAPYLAGGVHAHCGTRWNVLFLDALMELQKVRPTSWTLAAFKPEARWA